MRLWRYFRPGCLASLALVLIAGGWWTISSLNSSASAPSGYGASSPNGSASGPAVTGAAQPPPRNTPTWTGLLRITSTGTDLSVQPPTVVGDNVSYRVTVAYTPSQQTLAVGYAGLGGPAAIWPGATDPTYEQCLAQVQTQPLSQNEQQMVPYRQGQGVCIVTYHGVAMAFVRGISPPGTEAVEMHGIRWPMSH